jgi:hypothetical protein
VHDDSLHWEYGEACVSDKQGGGSDSFDEDELALLLNSHTAPLPG